jgi:hypothetical protein
MFASAKHAPSGYPRTLRKFPNRLRVEQLESRALPSAGLLNVLAEPALGPPNVVLNQAAFTPSQIRYAYGFYVSYDGDPQTGFAVYDSIPDSTTTGTVSGWVQVGGTSAGSPQWSALIAIADQGRALSKQPTLGDIQQIVYSLSSTDFHDVTTGANPFPADIGYDLATGIGTPIANIVVRDLVQNNQVVTIAPGLLPVLPFANFVMTPFSFTGSLMPTPTGSSSAIPFTQSMVNSLSQPSSNGMDTGSPMVLGREPISLPVQGPFAEIPAAVSAQANPLIQSQPTYILAHSNFLDLLFNRPAPDTMPLVPPDDEPARPQAPDQSAPSTDAPADARSGQKQDVVTAKSAAGDSDDEDEDDDDDLNGDWFWDGNDDDWRAATTVLPLDQTVLDSNQVAANNDMAATFIAAGLTFGLERRKISKSRACPLDLRRV